MRAILKFLSLIIVGYIFLMVNNSYCEVVRDSLEDMVVIATKTQERIEDAPGDITIITRKELLSQHIQTIDDALNHLSGIYFKRTKGLMDTTAAIRMRGFSGDKYCLILLDGQPLNDAYTGAVPWANIPISNIEKIEIIRGGASSLYGGNAMAGVINIITSSPKRFSISASVGYGSHETTRGGFFMSLPVQDRLFLSLDYEAQTTRGYVTSPVRRTISAGTGNVYGGYLMKDPYGSSKYWVVGDKGDNGGGRDVLSAKARYMLPSGGDLILSATTGRYFYKYYPPHTYMGTFGNSTTAAIAGVASKASFKPNDFISYTGIGEKESQILSLSANKQIGKMTFSTELGAVISDNKYTLETGRNMDFYDNSPGKLSSTTSEASYGEFKISLSPTPLHLLVGGVSFKMEDSDTSEYPIPFYRSFSGRGGMRFHCGGQSHTIGVFLEDQWKIAEPFSIYLGARYDIWRVYNGYSGVPGSEIYYKSNSESHLSPKLSMVYKVFKYTTLRASVGESFRPPTIYELYRTWTSWGTTYKSNPFLKPETVWTYEVGIQQSLFEGRTNISVTSFYNDITDLIYSRQVGTTKEKVNAAKGRTYGVEVELGQRLFDWLKIWGNLTYTNAKIVDNPVDPLTEGKKVTGIPSLMWNLGAVATTDKITFSLQGRYFSKIYTDAYNRDTEDGVYGSYEPALFLDSKLSIRPIPHFEISLSVDNLLNKRFYEYYHLDGRTYLLELTYRY